MRFLISKCPGSPRDTSFLKFPVYKGCWAWGVDSLRMFENQCRVSLLPLNLSKANHGLFLQL